MAPRHRSAHRRPGDAHAARHDRILTKEGLPMKLFPPFTKGIVAMSALATSSALAATFVYVSNAEDGEIGAYSMHADWALTPLARTQAAKVVMPMAGSPDPRRLYPASPSKPETVHVYAIDPGSGAPNPLSPA